MPGRLNIIRFNWSEAGSAIAPDGTLYQVQSEHVRGEGRVYWPQMRREDDLNPAALSGGWRDVGESEYRTASAARHAAERHWHERYRVAWAGTPMKQPADGPIEIGQRREFKSPHSGMLLYGAVSKIEGTLVTFDTGFHEGLQPRWYTVNLGRVGLKL